jgi:WD repeat-containing protein 55
MYECPDIYLDDHIMSLKFSPTQNILTVGQITGELRLYTYDHLQANEQLLFKHHTESIRSVDYSPDGKILYVASSDHSISVISDGRLEGHMKDCHKAAVNKVMHIENSHVIATGDDDGIVKVWDLRLATKGEKACVIEFKEHEGTVNDMAY